MLERTKHVVGLSGGKDSTALALYLRTTRQDINFTYLCTPTGNEPAEMDEHWLKLEQRLGQPIIRLTNQTLEYWIDYFKALPNWRQRWCTRLLKIEPTIQWLKENSPCVMYVGLRADEEEREGIYGEIPGVTFKYPFRELGWIEEDVWRYLAERNQTIPQRTDCEWCFFQRLIDWKRLRENKPYSYERASEKEQELTQIRGKSTTFRSPGRDTWPASLAELEEEFTKGRKIRGEDKQLSEDQLSCRVCRL